MKIVAIVQARLGSTRLPSKIFKTILDKTLLDIQIERMSRSKYISDIVIATTTNPYDDLIFNYCKEKNYEVFRGSEFDVLDRHYQAGYKFRADALMKIPSDCPLIDPEIIDNVIKFYVENFPKYDYVSNLHPASYPDGNDVEIMKFDVLTSAWRFSDKQYQREHTTPYLYENMSKFSLGNVVWERGIDLSEKIRLTLDYEEDYQFIKEIYERLYPQKIDFNLEDILKLLEEEPELLKINEKYTGQFWHKIVDYDKLFTNK